MTHVTCDFQNSDDRVDRDDSRWIVEVPPTRITPAVDGDAGGATDVPD